jgi:uncharacterized protein (UPF0276 family)
MAVESQRTGAAGDFAALPRLGVGVLFNLALPGFLRSHRDAWDYVEVIPDMFWRDYGADSEPRYEELEPWMADLGWIADRAPLIAHNIGLSLAGTSAFDRGYLVKLREWHERFGFVWHSDHLAFVDVASAHGIDHNAGLAVPVPYDREVLDLVAERVRRVQQEIQTPFLVENNVSFIAFPDQEMSEPEFLNRLAQRTGCGLLLDLHNVYTNARNHDFDAQEFVDAIDLERVIEVHIAGGSDLDGMWLDSHAGACPERVFELLEHVAAQAVNLRAITFEFNDSYFVVLGEDGLREQLDRARRIWLNRAGASS